MRKKFIIFMTIIYAVFSLTSCSFITINSGKEKVENKEEQQETAAQLYPEGVYPARDKYDGFVAQAQARVDALPARKLANQSFTVAVTPEIKFAPSDYSSEYNVALSKRNEMVSQKYSVSLGQVEAPADLMLSDAYASYLSGLYYSDIMMIPAAKLGEFAEKGFLLNVFSLPYSNYYKDYYDLKGMTQASAGNTAYAVMGDMTRDVGSYYCLYVNTELFERLGLEVPYASVEDGSWSWDKVLELTRQAMSVDGYVLKIGASTVSDLVSGVYKSSGQNYMSTWLGATPKVAYDTSLTAKVTQIIADLRAGDKILFDQYSNTGSALGDFRKGNLMFYVGTVAQMSEICKMGGEWTLLPMPKTDPAQEDYIAHLSSSAPVVVISASNPNTDDLAYVLDAINAASGAYLTEAYYRDLIYTSLNKSKTLDMLDYVTGIKAGKGMYDFVYMFGERYPELKENTYAAIWNCVITGGSLSQTASSAHYSLNWRMQNDFPVK
ncbi:MAG: hypothetical protein IJC50_02560 [Clostridia bacterium]|nr:hypothetical protein [Clostridia bacterium]